MALLHLLRKHRRVAGNCTVIGFSILDMRLWSNVGLKLAFERGRRTAH